MIRAGGTRRQQLRAAGGRTRPSGRERHAEPFTCLAAESGGRTADRAGHRGHLIVRLPTHRCSWTVAASAWHDDLVVIGTRHKSRGQAHDTQ